ncbi:MAG: S1 family peptidase [Kofleriaceae bacterium]
MCFAPIRRHLPSFLAPFDRARGAHGAMHRRHGRFALVAFAILVVALIAVPSGLPSAHAGPAPIVGGSPARSKDWPDVVAVLGRDGICTGTLVAPDVVLTAGHCIGIEPTEVITHADSLEPGAPHDRVDVKWSRAYPAWHERFDVGVVVLQRMARTRPRAIAMACLANEHLAAGDAVTIVGYGSIAPDASDDNTRLHAARVPVIDPFCKNAPGCLDTAGPNGEFAAGGRGTDACYGDSGGPAYLETPSGYALVGVTSRSLAIDGLPCGNGGIYTRADKVVAWIQSVTERRLERVVCEGSSDDPEATQPDEAGCATHDGGAGAGFAILATSVVLVRRRRCRRRTA